MAMEYGVCEKEYGEKLLAIIDKAIAQAPQNKVNLAEVDRIASAARLDKKNTDDGKINMAVAQERNAWTMLSLPFAEYCNKLREI